MNNLKTRYYEQKEAGTDTNLLQGELKDKPEFRYASVLLTLLYLRHHLPKTLCMSIKMTDQKANIN